MPKGITKTAAAAALKRAAKGDDLDEAPPVEPPVPEPEPEAGAAGAAGVRGVREDMMYWDGTIAEERSATGYCHTRQDAGTSSPAHVTVRPERETRPASICAALYIIVIVILRLPIPRKYMQRVLSKR